jgi:putative membrane protein
LPGYAPDWPAAFGFFLIKLNVFVDVAGAGTPHPLPAEDAGTFFAVAAHLVGLAMVGIGVAVIARSSAGFERTRRAIDSDQVVPMPQARVKLLLSTALAISVAISCIYLAVL